MPSFRGAHLRWVGVLKMSFATGLRSRALVMLLTFSVAVLGLPLQATPAAAVSPGIVISQIYGGGGNSGAVYQNDFVELFNRGTTTISLSGWSIQYASATGSGTFGSAANLITPLSGSILPGRYLLVQEASNAAVGAVLPAPDTTDGTPINMAGTGGKVALVNTTTALGCNGSSASPCSTAALASIVDLVGWDGANFFEGAAAAPATVNSTAVLRNHGGCDDSDNNGTDFTAGTPTPRNSASPSNPCGGTPQVTLTVTNAGGGTIASGDTKIFCGSTCLASYDAGTVVVLTPTAASGASFRSWTGACAGSGATCTLTLSANQTAGAIFSEQLTVTVSGNGTVTSTSGPISCPSTCTASFDFGTAVQLTAAPGTGSAFTGWSGGCTGTTSPCGVTMSGPRSVDASFAVSDAAPGVTATSPLGGTVDVAFDATIQVTFNEPVAVQLNDWYTLSCTRGATPTATTSGGPTTFFITPATPFTAGQTCTVTVLAALVTDLDTNDPPDTMAANFVFAFTTRVRIHDIQGAQHVSPFNGATVKGVPGIVTARRSSTTSAANNGLYIQDPNPDADDRTSESIFVAATNTLLGSLAVGDAIVVEGVVTEAFSTSTNLGITEITATALTKTGTGTIAPTILGIGGRTPPTTYIENDASGSEDTTNAVFDPTQDGMDFYESLEGMVVKIVSPRAVGPTRASFGELWVVGDNGASATTMTPRGGIVIDGPDFNPERILVDDELFKAGTPGAGCPSGSGAMPCVSTGATFTSDFVGVLEYGFGNYRVQLFTAPVVATNALTQETTLPAGIGQLAVGTFNVENLAPSDPDSKFAGLAALIVNNLKAPDLLALEEIQDNNGATDNGVVAAEQTLAKLIAAIQTAGGPTYQWRSIDPIDDQDGGQPGGNIRVAYIFRTDRGLSFIDRSGGTSTTANAVVGTGATTQLLYSPGRIAPADSAWFDSRKPLAAEWVFNAHHFFTIANHFVSKGGDQSLFGKTQPPVRSSEVKRGQQAALVNDFVRQIEAADPNADIVVLGDLNDFQFSNTMTLLKGSELRPLVDTLPVGERYTYNFEGNSQAIDHILLSNHMFTAVPFDYDIVHVNAEFNLQASDHDPQVVRLLLPDRVAPIVTAPADTTTEATSPNGAFLTPGTCSATDDVTPQDALLLDATYSGPGTFPLGTTTIECGATDAAGNRGSATFRVTVADTTPPSIATGGDQTFEATSPTGAVVDYASCSASDIASTPGLTYTQASHTQFGLGTTTVTCTATDGAGLTASAPFAIAVRDTTPPLVAGSDITIEATSSAGAAATPACTATDLVSSPAIAYAGTLARYPLGTTAVWCTATDAAGNAATATIRVTVVDTAQPLIQGSASPTANGAGWNNTPVTVTFACTDFFLASCTAPVTLSADGIGQSVTGTATDTSGNTSTVTLSGIKIDRTAPDVQFSGNTASYTVDQTVQITCSASDLLSGVATTTCAPISGPAWSFLGTNTFTAMATDVAGNSATATTSFTVVTTTDSLCALVRSLSTKDGVATSLCQKLRNAEAADGRGDTKAANNVIAAYRNELDAQTGKAFTAPMAALLKSLAPSY